MLEHGGRLREAAAHFQIPLNEWLDLSTGINPLGWPVDSLGSLPATLWQRLPEDQDELKDAARRYYGARSNNLLPVAGSQAAIQALPRVFHDRDGARQVGCLSPIYAEHPQTWRQAGHSVRELRHVQDAGDCDVLVLCNPNNPTGERYAPDDILALAKRQATGGGWLVVDEAFVDSRPELSVAAYAGSYAYPRLVVLRSIGKFFGLAGLRVGFVCAAPELLERLQEWIGPWTLSHPARHIAAKALSDSVWQSVTHTRLQANGERLAKYLRPLAMPNADGTPRLRSADLFVWLQPAMTAQRIYERLARQGILVRLFAAENTLRFGLPGSEAEWQRLIGALENTRLGDI